MTLNDLERQNRGFMDFLAISGCDRVHIIQKAPRNYRYAIHIENFLFVQSLSVNIPIFSSTTEPELL